MSEVKFRYFNAHNFNETSVKEDYEKVMQKIAAGEDGFTPYEHWLFLLYHDLIKFELVSAEKIDIALLLSDKLGFESDDLAFNVLRMLSGAHQVIHVVMKVGESLCDTYHFLTYNALTAEIGSYKEENGNGFIDIISDLSEEVKINLHKQGHALLKNACYPYGGNIYVLGMLSES